MIIEYSVFVLINLRTSPKFFETHLNITFGVFIDNFIMNLLYSEFDASPDNFHLIQVQNFLVVAQLLWTFNALFVNKQNQEFTPDPRFKISTYIHYSLGFLIYIFYKMIFCYSIFNYYYEENQT